MNKTYQAKKYSELSEEMQEEHLVNSICLDLAFQAISELTGIPIEKIIEKIAESANNQVDRMSKEAIKKSIENFDRYRESLREINPNLNGVIIQDSQGNAKKGFRSI